MTHFPKHNSNQHVRHDGISHPKKPVSKPSNPQAPIYGVTPQGLQYRIVTMSKQAINNLLTDVFQPNKPKEGE